MNYINYDYYYNIFNNLYIDLENNKQINPIYIEYYKNYKNYVDLNIDNKTNDDYNSFNLEKIKIIIEKITSLLSNDYIIRYKSFNNIDNNNNCELFLTQINDKYKINNNKDNNISTKNISNDSLNIKSVIFNKINDISIFKNLENNKILNMLYKSNQLNVFKNTLTNKELNDLGIIEESIDVLNIDNYNIIDNLGYLNNKLNNNETKSTKEKTKFEKQSVVVVANKLTNNNNIIKSKKTNIEEKMQDDKNVIEEIFGFTKMIKKYATNSGKILKSDNAQLNSTEKMLYDNTTSTEKELNNLNVINQEDKISFFKLVLTVVFVFVSFMIALMIVRIFPRFI